MSAAEPARHLQLVDTETGQVVDDGPTYAELTARLQAAEELNLGQEATIKSQAAMIGRLKGKLEAADPEAHPRHKEMAALIERWRTATGHEKSKASKDRFDLIRARFNDGYEIETIELAIDGLGAFPFVVSAERRREGPSAQRYDQLKHALNGGQDLERFANLGHRARKEGWTLANGWPT